MKKLIYPGLFLAVLSLSVAACDKETSVNSKSSTKSSQQNPTLKSSSFSEADLIAAINGSKPDYVDLSDLEDLLLDHTSLSDNVIQALIAETRVPDYIVETLLAASAPVSSAQLTYLNTKRPTLATTAIVAAAAADAEAGFIIVNTSPRQIVFGIGIKRTSTCNCGDGQIVIESKPLLVDLTSTTPDPAKLKSCNSSNTKWYCGTPVRVTLTGTDGTNAIYTSNCEQSTERCVRKPRDARSNTY